MLHATKSLNATTKDYAFHSEMFTPRLARSKTSTDGFKLTVSLCYKELYKLTVMMQLGWRFNEAKISQSPYPLGEALRKGKVQ